MSERSRNSFSLHIERSRRWLWTPLGMASIVFIQKRTQGDRVTACQIKVGKSRIWFPFGMLRFIDARSLRLVMDPQFQHIGTQNDQRDYLIEVADWFLNKKLVEKSMPGRANIKRT